MGRPLRIAVFVGSFPLISETFILRQIIGLMELGHEVDIYADCAPAAGTLAQPEVSKYGLVQRTTYMDAPPASVPWEMPVLPIGGKTWLPGAEQPIPNLSRIWQALPTLASGFLRAPRLTVQALSPTHYGHQATSLSALYRLVKLGGVKRRYDILHAHFGPVGNSFRFARTLWRAPFVVSFHGYDFTSAIKKSGPAIYRHLFREANAVTANSDFMSNKLVEIGCGPEKIHKLRYGVDAGQLSALKSNVQSDGKVTILTVGRLVEKKGIEVSIRAFAEAHKTNPQMRYDIVGDGPLRSKLQMLIAELGVSDLVTLHGAKDGRFISDLLSRAEIFILASVTAADGDQEGTPVSLLEAQAAGVPVISTRHSGIPEIVQDGVTGLLTAERDVAALSQQIDFLVQHPESRRKMADAGRGFVSKNFQHSHCVKQLVSIYETVLDSCNPK